MEYKFTERAKQVLEIANNIAIELGHNYVGTEHILYGLSKEESGVASRVLENQNINSILILEKIEELIGKGENENKAIIGLTPRTKRVIENAFREARKTGSDYIGTEHILLGIMRETDSIAIRILLELNVSPQKLYSELLKVINEYDNQDTGLKTNGKGSYNSTPTLNQFGNDLSKSAIERKT